MKRKKRSLVILAALALLLTAGSAEAYAQEKQETCLVQLELTDLGTPREGAEFDIFQVGRLSQGALWLLEEYEAAGVDLNHLETAEAQRQAAKKLEGWTLKRQPLANGKTDADGRLSFGKLDWGAYLIVQQSEASYGKVDPFLVMLPCMEDGEAVTALTLSPKAARPDTGDSPDPDDPHEDGGSQDGKPEDPGKPAEPGRTQGARTGDEANPGFYLAVLLLAAAAAAALVIWWRRRR